MPRYDHDPTAVTASIPILPKDDYEFEIGRPKAFERTAKKGHQSYGIRFPLRVVGGPQDGKRTVLTCYLHSEGAAQMTKRFEIAVAGFPVTDAGEKQFNAWQAGKDASYDTTDGSVGEYWADFEGKHVMCDLDLTWQKDDAGEVVQGPDGNPIEQQAWGTWRPVTA